MKMAIKYDKNADSNQGVAVTHHFSGIIINIHLENIIQKSRTIGKNRAKQKKQPLSGFFIFYAADNRWRRNVYSMLFTSI